MMTKIQTRLSEIYSQSRIATGMIHNFTEADFKKYIAVGFFFNPPINIMIGKVVQVRKESGAFGSDQIFLRCQDGLLQVHENQSFYYVPERFTKELDELFSTVPDEDKPNTTYSMMHKHKRKGFIIKSKVKEGETTPMREIHSLIMGKIEERINKN